MKNIARNGIGVVVTAKNSEDRLSDKGHVALTEERPDVFCAECIELDTSRTFQTIEGFGGAFTEAGAYTLSRMSPEKRMEVINAYFDESQGLGYSLCRTHINSCDFSLGNYCYDDIEGDYQLKHFSISHDEELLIPFIKDAMDVSREGFKLFASPWSPPAWMKTNGKMNNGGALKSQCYNSWALYIAKYIKAYINAGIPIWAITVQNEPDAVQKWDSCVYSNQQERDFLKFYLGPKLVEQGLQHVKIIVWDHNKDILVERISTIISDPEAAKYAWGIGFHWYAGTFFENLSKVHKFFPNKTLISTESCKEGGVKLGSWDSGETYGHAIIGDLNNWTAGWVDWNMVLDEKGGPNHAKNYCDAPIIADTKTGKLHYQSSYYYLGHFSKYIRPGATKIHCLAKNELLETTAFQNLNGSVVVVVMNRSDESIDFNLEIQNYNAKLESPPHSIQTLKLNR